MSEFRVPLSEIELTYVRSSGPGGQNVNKVNSKAVLRWNLLTSPSVGEELRARLLARLANQLTREGELLVTSDRFRDQIRNREDCIEKLHAILRAAAARPKNRKPTKPTHGSQLRARTAKTHNSRKKEMRRGGRGDD